MTLEEIKKAKAKYSTHKAGAKSRNIPFNMTFDEWLTFWLDSGHWHERGNKAGQYVMSRKNDIGPYELGNVFIQSQSQNTIDGRIGKQFSAETKKVLSEKSKGRLKGKQISESTKQKISVAHKGKILSDEHKAKISLTKKLNMVNRLNILSTISLVTL